jgi:hypothetical protein
MRFSTPKINLLFLSENIFVQLSLELLLPSVKAVFMTTDTLNCCLWLLTVISKQFSFEQKVFFQMPEK